MSLSPLGQVPSPISSVTSYEWSPVPERIAVSLDKIQIAESITTNLEGPGSFPPGFDVESYNQMRYKNTAYSFVPGPFSKGLHGCLSPEAVPPQFQCTSLKDLTTRQDRSSIHLVFLRGINFTPKDFDNFLRIIAPLRNLQYLILHNCQVKSIDKLSCTFLRYLDLCNNPISKINVNSLTSSCPYLEHIDLRETGLKVTTLHQLIGKLRYIRSINREIISPALRATSIQKFASSELKNMMHLLLWDLAVMKQPIISTMTSWMPLHLREIDASNCELFVFHVGEFKALEKLVLCNNHITSIDSRGLEHLERLTILDLRNNQLSKINDFSTFSLIPSLAHLLISGNKYKGNYRPLLISTCRTLKGTNKQPGLNSIDGVVVTIDEIINSCLSSGMSKSDAEDYRWSLVCIRNFGHVELYSPNASSFVALIKNGRFSSAGLSNVDLTLFPGLELLDLSRNNLDAIIGLESLTNLQFLDVSNNSKLNLDSLLTSIDKLQNLFQFNVISSTSGINSNELNQHRIKLIARLFFSTPKLSVLNNHSITIIERVEALKLLLESKVISEIDLNLYYFYSSILYVLPIDRVLWRPDDVMPGQQYDPLTVLELRLGGIFNYDLFDRNVLNFSKFKNLRALDLSKNGITSLSSFGIEELSNLTVLDFRNNPITHKEIDTVIFITSSLPLLNSLFLQGCPCMSTQHDRSSFLSSLPLLRKPNCALKVVDTVITMNERLFLWKQGGLSEKECQALMFRAAINFCFPLSTDEQLKQIQSINFSGMNLSFIDLQAFSGVKSVVLANNKINSLLSSNINNCINLEILDLRANQFSTLRSLLPPLNSLVNLRYLGLAENPVTRTKGFVVQLLGSFELLRNTPCKLVSIDDIQIESNLVANSWFECGGNTKEVELFRFKSSLMSHLPAGFSACDISELNLSEHGLSVIDLSPFTSLERLYLSKNGLNNDALRTSNIDKLKKLTFLDISGNRIKDLNLIAELIDCLPSISEIIVNDNPATSSSSHRESLLKKLECIKSPMCTLTKINGQAINLDELCRFAGISSKELNSFKISVLAFRQGVANGAVSLDISGIGITSLSGISSYPNLLELNASNNEISELNIEDMSALISLKSINLKSNKIKDFSIFLETLSYCPSLQQISILNSTGDKLTESLDNYLLETSKTLRGVLIIDEEYNEHCLNENQISALNFLSQFGTFSINRVHSIDFRPFANSITEAHFVAVLRALSYLPIIRLNIDIPAFKGISNLRFMFIFMIPTLISLNGTIITLEEKSNAYSICAKLAKKSGLDFLKHPAPYLLTPVSAALLVASAELTGSSQKGPGALTVAANKLGPDVKGNSVNPEKLAPEGEAPGTPAGTPSEPPKTPPEINLNLDSVKNVAENFGKHVSNAYSSVLRLPFFMSMGSFLNKLEIITGFFQVLALIFAFSININIKFPDFLIIYYKYLTIPFTINFDWIDVLLAKIDDSFNEYILYAKFGFFMLLPIIFLIFYFYDFDVGKWTEKYVIQWPRHRFMILMTWIFGLITTFLIGTLIIDPESFDLVLNHQWPSPSAMGFILAIGGSWSLLVFLYYLNATIFRNHHDDPAYWFRYIKAKKRICLFSLTITFMPVCRIILVNFVCNDDGYLDIAPDHKCGETFQDFSLFQIISFALGLLFIIGIPLFFFLLIRRGVKLIVLNYDIENKEFIAQEEIRKLNQFKPNGFKQRIKEIKKEIKKDYSVACQEFTTPQSYLFSAYRKSLRYWKIAHMLEKSLLLAWTVFLASRVDYGKLTVGLSSITLSFFFVIGMITRPMADYYEVLMDNVSRGAAVLTAVAATLMSSDWYQNSSSFLIDIFEPALIVVHVVNSAFLGLMMFIAPIKSFISVRQLKAAWDLARQGTSTATDVVVSAANPALSAVSQSVGSIVNSVAKMTGQGSSEPTVDSGDQSNLIMDDDEDWIGCPDDDIPDDHSNLIDNVDDNDDIPDDHSNLIDNVDDNDDIPDDQSNLIDNDDDNDDILDDQSNLIDSDDDSKSKVIKVPQQAAGNVAKNNPHEVEIRDVPANQNANQFLDDSELSLDVSSPAIPNVAKGNTTLAGETIVKEKVKKVKGAAAYVVDDDFVEDSEWL
ncbi:hypothetical protein RCL1_006230 [Eukaryota sp. TZLM3-RCL]